MPGTSAPAATTRPGPSFRTTAYYALAGATTELVRAEVRRGRTDAVTSLEDTLVALHLAVLAGQPWAPPPP